MSYTAGLIWDQPNLRSALDARAAHCFHIERHWPAASESERWADLAERGTETYGRQATTSAGD